MTWVTQSYKSRGHWKAKRSMVHRNASKAYFQLFLLNHQLLGVRQATALTCSCQSPHLCSIFRLQFSWRSEFLPCIPWIPKALESHTPLRIRFYLRCPLTAASVAINPKVTLRSVLPNNRPCFSLQACPGAQVLQCLSRFAKNRMLTFPSHVALQEVLLQAFILSGSERPFEYSIRHLHKGKSISPWPGKTRHNPNTATHVCLKS